MIGLVGFFDIEAIPIGKGNGTTDDFICGAILTPHGDYQTFLDRFDMVRAMFNDQTIGWSWYCHNAEYDLKFIIPTLCELMDNQSEIQLIVQGNSGRTIGIKYKYPYLDQGLQRTGICECRDTFPLMPSSLAKLTQAFHTEHQKLKIDFDGRPFDPSNEQDMIYLKHDIIGLAEVWRKYCEVLENVFECFPCWTAGSTAVAAWKHSIPEGIEYPNLPIEIEEFVRKGYYGGHVFLTTVNEVEDCTYIDFNSMYPSVMKLGVPFGIPVKTTEYRADLPGFWECWFSVSPETCKHPFIRYKTMSGSAAPYGEFISVATSIEIEAAKKHGYTVVPIRGMVFAKLCFPFNDFVDMCEKLRIKHKGDAIETVVKLTQNSLYGKFGTKRETVEYLITKNIPSPEWIKFDDQIHTADNWEYLYAKKSRNRSPIIMPHWSAWITANARLKLMNAIWSFGEKNVVYGDTDSIVVKREAFIKSDLKPGVKYGDFKIEHDLLTFRAQAPKNYKGLERDGKTLRKSKGIPAAAVKPEEHDKAICGEMVTVNCTFMNSILKMMKISADQWKKGTRSYSLFQNSENWCVLEDGSVVAHTVHMTPPDTLFRRKESLQKR
jgi:hypothetical protein